MTNKLKISKLKRKVQGFSLVELLVTMAIIAVLLGLVGFGIATAQRNSRDSQRRQTVSDVRLALEDYLTRTNQYPTAAQFSQDGTQITIGSGVLPAGSEIQIEVSGAQVPAATTGSGGTQYCYQADGNGGYILGAKLENGDWFDQSSTIAGTAECSDSNAPSPFF
ncbi:MAG: type II secretion system protein [Candidatus Dojkabacteria bacterium]